MGANRLDLSYNSFELLTPKIFHNASRILELKMVDNRLRKIERLVNMPNILRLDLSYNQITTLPDGIFNESLHLRKLRLSHNFVCCIDGLKVLSTLKTLFLDDNRIHSFPYLVFRKLENLESLNLAGNLIYNINDLPNNLLLISFICVGNLLKSVNFYQPVVKEVSYVINLDDNPLGYVNISGLNAEALYLSNCSVDTVYALNRMERLRYIFLSMNLITRLTEDVLFDLPNVYGIVLKYNLIEQFPLIYLPSLKFFSLDGNKIRHITKAHLHALPNLSGLYLGYNFIEYLSELSHEMLEELDLRGNVICFVSSITAQNFPKLKLLFLTDNRIMSLSDVNGVLTIPYLYLTGNQISVITENGLLLGTSWLELRLSNNILTTINFSIPSNVRTVFLKNNRIDRILFGSLCPQIQFLFLSVNRISSLSFVNSFPNLVSFDLSGNMISQVTRNNFRRTTAMEDINLSGNSIYILESHVLTKLTNLKRINLSNNFLTTLGEFALPHKSLEYLALNANNLTDISRNVFTGVPKERIVLHLSDNALSNCSSLLSSLSRTIWFLNATNFSQDEETTFSALHNIEFSQLSILYLSSLNLTGGLYPLNAPNLASLRLNFNRFKIIPRDVFTNMPDISDVFLIGNSIEYIRKEDFKTLGKLYQINLEKNHITFIETGAFTFTRKLRVLNLSNNYIKHLSYDAMLGLVIQLNGLGLDDNPWDCTCELRWLQTELAYAKGETRLQCSSPPYMANRSIIADKLDYPPAPCNSMPRNQTVVVFEGDLIQISCPVVLDNVDSIEWFINSYSSFLNMSTSTPGVYFVSEVRSQESAAFLFSVTRNNSDIVCSAANRAGTTPIAIPLKVCNPLNRSNCIGNGSVTVAEWNEQVARNCFQPSALTLATTSARPWVVTNRAELGYSNVPALTVIMISIVLTGTLKL